LSPCVADLTSLINIVERKSDSYYSNSNKIRITCFLAEFLHRQDNSHSWSKLKTCTFSGDVFIKYKSSITPNAGMSHKEKDLVDYIKLFYTGQVLENRRKIIYPNELDIFLPDLKLAMEFNGNYWHSIENGCSKDYHLKKSLLCKDKGIRLIHIYEFEDIEYQKLLLKSLILGKDIYSKLDFNKNNFIMPIPKLYKNKTNKGTVYSIGPIIKEEN